jgi:predicted secreted protein
VRKLTEQFNSISVKRGELFEVNLLAKTGESYDWNVVVSAGKATFLGKTGLLGPDAEDDAESCPPGTTRQRFLFRADEAGTIELKAYYKKAWELPACPTKILRVKVT